MSGFYPLYLHDLTPAEKQLLKKILRQAKVLGVFRESQLESSTGLSFRHILGPAFQEGDSHGRGRATVSQEKWVALYNHTMGDVRRIAEARRLNELVVAIDDLHALGIASGRYDRDMHIFNSRHMQVDSTQSTVGRRYMDDGYVGFRYRSTGDRVLVSYLQLEERDGRPVFESRVLGDPERRVTLGVAYGSGTHIVNLFGFLNLGKSSEHFVLDSDDETHGILTGLITTMNNEGSPHAKTCFFVKLSRLYGTEHLDHRALRDSRESMRELEKAAAIFFPDPDQKTVHLRDGDHLRIDDYLYDHILRPRRGFN